MNKLNNKGFAITTILFGTMILFLLLLVSLLGILSTYRKNLNKLIGDVDGTDGNGAREIITAPARRQTVPNIDTIVNNTSYVGGLYCFSDITGVEGLTATNNCKYISTSELNERRNAQVN